MHFKRVFSFLAAASVASATHGSIRSRDLTDGPDPRAGKILDCFLVNLASKVEIKLDGDDDYTPSDSNKGWSIYCKTLEPGKVDYVKFFYIGKESTQYYSSERYSKPWLQPFWMEGDNNKLTIAGVNDVEYLATPGPKTITVKFYTWAGGNEYPGDEKTYYLNSGGGPPPVPSPTPLPPCPIPRCADPCVTCSQGGTCVTKPAFFDFKGRQCGGCDTLDKCIPVLKFIQDIIEDTPTFSTLETAVEIAGLEDTFRSPGPFTLFAPTDAAFAALPQGPLAALLANPLALKNLLLYHVLNGELPEATLKAISPATLPTLSGDNVKITTVSGAVTINADAEIVDPDNFASNGVVHGIDSVLCNNGGFTCPVGTTPTTICPQSEAECACNNGGFVCPPGFDPTSACPLNFATGCVCNNGGFTCPQGSFATNGCPKSIDDCVCGSSFSCPVGTVAVGFCPTGPGDCQCNNGGFACPTGFVPTNDCPLSIADCVCDAGGITCPIGFVPTKNCPLTTSDCECGDTFSCPTGSTSNTACPLTLDDCDCDNTEFTCPKGFVPLPSVTCPSSNNDCVCSGAFQCPVLSSSKTVCPLKLKDCKCDNKHFTFQKGECKERKLPAVAVCGLTRPTQGTVTFSPPVPFDDVSIVLSGPCPYSWNLPKGATRGLKRDWANFGAQKCYGMGGATTHYLHFKDNVTGKESHFARCASALFSSPIGIDVDGSGAVERIDGNFTIDISGDGKMEFLHEWFAPTEGILISTTPFIQGGRVTGENMFGDMGAKYKDGYEKLGLLDRNNDQIVSGAELQGLAVWLDINSNTLLDDDELFSLEHFDITGLRTDEHGHFESSAILMDGSELYMEDLWFTSERHEEANRGTDST